MFNVTINGLTHERGYSNDAQDAAEGDKAIQHLRGISIYFARRQPRSGYIVQDNQKGHQEEGDKENVGRGPLEMGLYFEENDLLKHTYTRATSILSAIVEK